MTTYYNAQIHEEETSELFDEESPCISGNSKKISKASKKVKSYKRAWTPLEDCQLLNLRAIHGNKWTLIGDLIGGRSCKQVRDRYLNYLNPEVKTTAFTPEEDAELILLFHQLGRKWKMIANQMAGRSESQVKNRFYRHLVCKEHEGEKDMFNIKRIDSLGNNSNVDTEACSTPESTFLSQQLPFSMKQTYSFLQNEFFNSEGYGEKMMDLQQQISFENSSRSKAWDVEHFFSSVNPAVEVKGREIDLLEGRLLSFVKMNSIN